MTDFLVGAGCVVRIRSGGEGAFKVEGWPNRFYDGSGLILIDNIVPQESDIVAPVIALDGHRVLYKFGENFGNLTVVGTAYLGAAGKSGSAMIEKLKSAYDKLRVSSSSKPTNVSITSGYSVKAYVTGFSITQTDANFQRVSYSLTCMIAPPPQPSK